MIEMPAALRALRRGILAGLLLAVALAGAALAFPTPERTGWVTDEAEILDDATEAAIAARLQALKDETGIEIVVVTLRSLQGLSIETWGDLLGESWGVGRAAGKDDGALLIVAPSARKVRIAVGYGLNRSIPDSTAQEIIDQQIIPRFRSGDLAGGVTAGAKAMTVYAEMGSPTRALKLESDPDFPAKPKISLSPIMITVGVMIACVVILLILHGARHISVAVSSPPRAQQEDDRPDAAEAAAAATTSSTTPDAKTTAPVAVGNVTTDNDGFWATLLQILLENARQNSASNDSSWSPTSWSSHSSRSSSWSFGSSSSSSRHSFSSSSSSSGSRRSFGGGASGSW